MRAHRLNISDTISISVSAAAIFSEDEGCGRPPLKRKDMTIEIEAGLMTSRAGKSEDELLDSRRSLASVKHS